MSLISVWREWRERRATLRELAAFRVEDKEWDPYKVRELLGAAERAVERGDYPLATRMWEQAFSLSPQDVRNLPVALSVLLGLKRYDDAERLMLDGQAKTPSDSRYLLGLVRIALEKGDLDAAVKHSAALRTRFPNLMDGYAVAIAASRRAKRLDEAEFLVRLGMQKFPDEVLMFMEYAGIAADRENWGEAVDRWNVVHQRFSHPSGYAGAGRALIQCGRFAEADKVLALGRMRWPVDASIAITWAECAQQGGNAEEAITRWKRVAYFLQMHLVSVLAAANGLQALGAIQDAKDILVQAVHQLRFEPSPLIALGKLLISRREFDDAAAAFEELRTRFGNQEDNYQSGMKMLHDAGYQPAAKN